MCALRHEIRTQEDEIVSNKLLAPDEKVRIYNEELDQITVTSTERGGTVSDKYGEGPIVGSNARIRETETGLYHHFYPITMEEYQTLSAANKEEIGKSNDPAHPLPDLTSQC